ncbi:MAG: zinc ribbon domain-containing protein [Firmicutes bacterium]|nr:zinc ribbon domain-containing protein [Bacillota bacterium]
MTWALGLLVAAILLIQAIWIFLDARRRGENHWLWGFFGLLNFPSSLFVYLLVTRRPWSGARSRTQRTSALPGACGGCGKPLAADWIACPYCGERREDLLL